MPQFDAADFQVLYPGVFSPRERDLAEKYIADNQALTERGEIDVQALIGGKLPADTPGLVDERLLVAEDMVRYNSYKYDPENPLLHDAEYAQRAGYKDILAMPCCNRDFVVDLAWWIESIEGDIWLEGGATVKLPSRRAK